MIFGAQQVSDSIAHFLEMPNVQPRDTRMTCATRVTCATQSVSVRTVGGCVWTAEDLEKPPNAWENREELYWERQRCPGQEWEREWLGCLVLHPRWAAEANSFH